MLITDKELLKQYCTDYRIWQGIPGIEVTKNGRIFSAFYSGGIDEEIGNYIVLLKSDDGEIFSEPIAAVYKENSRCFDDCLWIDPLGRFWLIWSVMPDNAVYGVICDNPDAEELVWGEEFLIGYDVMMNKPTVLKTGEWLFPIAVWGERVWSWMPERKTKQKEFGSFVYKSVDNGKTFTKLGGAYHPDHSFDEHMVIELKDDRLMMLIRTMSGIGVSYSYNNGKVWTECTDSGFGGPNSRFHIRRLKSGRILLVNHYDYKFSDDNPQGRNNLTALISDDECKTWKYKLIIDERNQVSYPDATEGDDGFIYITYDRDRGCGKKSLDEAYDSPREILYAKITEDDIIAGRLVNPKSKLKCVVSKLGMYKGELNPFESPPRHKEYAEYFAGFGKEEGLKKLFKNRELEKLSLSKEQGALLDKIIDGIDEKSDLKMVFCQIMDLLFKAKRWMGTSLVGKVREEILNNGCERLTEAEIAKKIGVSRYYIHYCFKTLTAITVEEYSQVLTGGSKK